MGTPDDLAPIRRILVALDATRASGAALEAAVSLAEHLEAELLGLFVEDVNLLRLAALPFAHEVGFPSARARRLESADMERTLRAQATLAQQALVMAVRKRRVSWSFRVVRGQVVTELLAASQQADLIAIAMTRTGVSRSARPGSATAILSGAARTRLTPPPGMNLCPPIVVIYDGSPASRQALILASRLTPDEAPGMVVLILADDSEAEQRLRQEAAARLPGRGVAARFRWVVAADAASLAQAVEAESAGTLVLAGDSPVLPAATVRQLLAEADCAVLLIR
jgi:nucleotide-binding universal stress UspA family protein